MSQFSVDSVLAQIRSMQGQISGAAAPKAQPPAAGGVSFMDSLKGAVDSVNKTQHAAQKAATDFELGRTDIASAVMAMQSSQVAFKAMTEVRNKVVRAYQDIMNMPI
jgi:flagellar hook-basal body complex protein FliE